MGYQLATRTGSYNEEAGLDTLSKYADLYGLTDKSGVEIGEYAPDVSTKDPVRSAIGQGSNSYTTVGLARYVTTIASRGTSYELSLLDKVTDSKGEIIEDYTPEVKGDMDVADHTWTTVQKGMRGVAKNNASLSSLSVSVAGKTGTAQEDLTRPSHALFMGFAPYENPEVGIAVRIGNGYASSNAVDVAKDILRYNYNLADESEIVTGTASSADTTTTRND